ncbi:hypothetical protein CDSM653_02309 [Caldanaerobacter subterraneus subsp. pacificus DSM 12653]|uniref:Uncharacterized protein n=1 Tax=Caldanaerobacter subterraneus subsp. pacificus DSM 12653 TaxID=391606 RepID=A0A0F5PJY1_9THEO|nr:hypothetical protein CDSM653_02309 [Caldanaerobacter subterraneus subsp. pacificus DSM 12653]
MDFPLLIWARALTFPKWGFPFFGFGGGLSWGFAQLFQLRGRVGSSNRLAYAFFYLQKR